MKLKPIAKIRFLLRAIQRTCVVLYRKRSIRFFSEYKRMIKTCLWLEKGSQEYLNRQFFNMSDEELRKIYDNEVKEKVEKRIWLQNHRRRMYILSKYGAPEYSTTQKKVRERVDAYEKEFGIPKDCSLQWNVSITCQHSRMGLLKIGHHVILCRDVDLDFTGNLIIEDYAWFAEGVKVITHNHKVGLQEDYDCIPTSVVIRDHAHIFARAVIMPQAAEIGRHSVVATGAIVVKQVPPYAIVAGVPAKVLKFVASADEISKYEAEHYPLEQRIPIDVLRENEKKYISKS